jgi:Neuraminidase (sialidase)
VQKARDAATEKAQELQRELGDRFGELRRRADGYYASVDDSLTVNRQATEAAVGRVSQWAHSLEDGMRLQLGHHDQQIQRLSASQSNLEHLRAEHGEEMARQQLA